MTVFNFSAGPAVLPKEFLQREAAMIKRDGCDFCTACGYTGHCS